MKRIYLDRKKSKKLFYDIKNLSLFFSSLGTVIQNPDFAVSKDLKDFKENCKKFEMEYNNIKTEIENLFKNARSYSGRGK